MCVCVCLKFKVSFRGNIRLFEEGCSSSQNQPDGSFCQNVYTLRTSQILPRNFKSRGYIAIEELAVLSAFKGSMNLPVRRIQPHKHGEDQRCTRLIINAIEVFASLAAMMRSDMLHYHFPGASQRKCKQGKKSYLLSGNLPLRFLSDDY